jgi:hypothetical protein
MQKPEIIIKSIEDIVKEPKVLEYLKDGWYISDVSFNDRGRITSYSFTGKYSKKELEAMKKANTHPGFLQSGAGRYQLREKNLKSHEKADELSEKAKSLDYDLVGMQMGPFFPRLHNAGYYLNEKAQQVVTYVRNLVYHKK